MNFPKRKYKENCNDYFVKTTTMKTNLILSNQAKTKLDIEQNRKVGLTFVPVFHQKRFSSTFVVGFITLIPFDNCIAYNAKKLKNVKKCFKKSAKKTGWS